MRRGTGQGDPFRALGLERSRELANDDVRAAWRRVAAATHPDRADGGDAAAFATAAAAYTVLRTPAGRGEALADLLAPGGGAVRSPVMRFRLLAIAPGGVPLLAIRIRRGRPLVLTARLLAVAALGAIAVAAAGWQPASLGIMAGALTWLTLTVRSDLAPPP